VPGPRQQEVRALVRHVCLHNAMGGGGQRCAGPGIRPRRARRGGSSPCRSPWPLDAPERRRSRSPPPQVGQAAQRDVTRGQGPAGACIGALLPLTLPAGRASSLGVPAPLPGGRASGPAPRLCSPPSRPQTLLLGQTPEVALRAAAISIQFFRQQQALAEDAREKECERRERQAEKRMAKARAPRAARGPRSARGEAGAAKPLARRPPAAPARLAARVACRGDPRRTPFQSKLDPIHRCTRSQPDPGPEHPSPIENPNPNPEFPPTAAQEGLRGPARQDPQRLRDGEGAGGPLDRLEGCYAADPRAQGRASLPAARPVSDPPDVP
jgi:hypothetical protein